MNSTPELRFPWYNLSVSMDSLRATGVVMPPAKELSGAQWVARFPDAGDTGALAPSFRTGCEAFIAAMRAAGATVAISSTRRPKERAWLMHYAWRIHKQTLNPQNVPVNPNINIEWVHPDGNGGADLQASRQAATAMVNGYDIAFQPALASRHVEGNAIDMTISWSGKLDIKNKAGAVTTITSTPRSGFNADLRRVGKSFGVTKHPTDPPHWSTDGH
jgi:hypothetical protein